MAISWFICNWPKLQVARYLELGVAGGHHLASVGAREKIGVDIQSHLIESPDFKFCLTDTGSFFQSIFPSQKWDLIYIDADHAWRCVLQDLNNSIAHLEKGGIIILHDLFPQEASLTARWYCEDAYKVLLPLKVRAEQGLVDLWVCDSDYGVTIVRGAEKLSSIQPEEVDACLSYEDFRKKTADLRLYTIEEFKEIASRL